MAAVTTLGRARAFAGLVRGENLGTGLGTGRAEVILLSQDQLLLNKSDLVSLPFSGPGLGVDTEKGEVVRGADFCRVVDVERVATRRVVELVEQPDGFVVVARDWATRFSLPDDGVVEGFTMADGIGEARRWEIGRIAEEHIAVTRRIGNAANHAIFEVPDVVGRALAAAIT